MSQVDAVAAWPVTWQCASDLASRHGPRRRELVDDAQANPAWAVTHHINSCEPQRDALDA
ncbi:MAG: hypothetical protein H0T17_07030 [Propionibacteriales bacterium]|nr:hypothetical protein [Propionibacteriales bacterium]